MGNITGFDKVRNLFTEGKKKSKAKDNSEILELKERLISDLEERLELIWSHGDWGEMIYRKREILFKYGIWSLDVTNKVSFMGVRILSNSQTRKYYIESSTDGNYIDLRDTKNINEYSVSKNIGKLYNYLKDDGFEDCFCTTPDFYICINLNRGYSKNSRIGKVLKKINNYNKELEKKINKVANVILDVCYDTMSHSKLNPKLWSSLESVKTMGFLFDINALKTEYPIRFNGFFYKLEPDTRYNNIENEDRLEDIEYYAMSSKGRYIGEELKLLCKYLYELGADNIYVYSDMDLAVTININ